MTLYKHFNNFSGTLKNYKEAVKKLQTYSANSFYKERERKYRALINSDIQYLKHFVSESLNDEIKLKFKEIQPLLLELVSDQTPIIKKVKLIDDLEFEWPEIGIILGKHKDIPEGYNIPNTIPEGEAKEDLNEAIRCFNGKNYLATLVMCRRAYEAALSIKFQEMEKKYPLENLNCPSCNKVIINSKPINITKLHKWAIGKELIPSKLDNIGYIIPRLGSGGAHYSKEKLPRDPDIAKVSLITTLTLLKLLYT